MELFFSYGHDDNTPLVDRLKDDLNDRGHSVWIDHEKIADRSSIETHDSNWRQSITNGIEKSSIVLSFASAHALRDNGVCLDELKIAVFVRGAFVQAILLEEQMEGFVPASISHRQYKDFSEWKSYALDGKAKGAEFEEWYKEKLEDLLATLSEDEVQSYHDELKRTAELLGLHYPYINTSKQDELAKSSFVGREWLSEMVHEWAKGNEGKRERALVITGSPGIGKSAFVVNEFMRSPDVAAAVFCRFDDQGANNIDAIARSIAYQMAARYDDFRKRLLTVLEEEETLRERGNEPTESAFNRYVFNIARNLIDGNREYFIILIDGLDEVSLVGGRNPVAKALKRELREGRDFVRFVLTSRNDKHVLGPLESAPKIDLDVFAAKGKADVASYVKGKLDWEKERNPEIAKRIKDDPNLAQRIIEASDGNFLYATLACSQIDRLPAKGELPRDLGDFYEEAMDRLRDEIEELDDETERLSGEMERRGDKANFYGVPEALGIIAASDGNVPEKTLRRAVGWDKGRGRRVYDKFLNCLSMYITETREASGDEPTLSFFHKSFADWLTSRAGADYSQDREYSRELLAKACLKAYEKCVEDGSFDGMNDYEMINLLPLLEENKSKEEFKEKYRRVLSDSAFFDELLKRAKESKNLERVRLLERIVACFPDIDSDALADGRMWEAVELQRVRVFEMLGNAYGGLLRLEEQERYLEETAQMRERLMKASPTPDAVESYSRAILSWASMHGTSLQYPRNPEKLRDIFLREIDALRTLEDGFAPAAAMLKPYSMLMRCGCGDQNARLSYAQDWVALADQLLTNDDLRTNDLSDLNLISNAYVELAKIYVKQGDIRKACELLNRGKSLIGGCYGGQQSASKEAETNRAELHYRALRILYSAELDMARNSNDARETIGIIDACLSFVDAVILNLDTTPTEKASEIEFLFMGLFISLSEEGSSPELQHLVTQLQSCFAKLEDSMEDMAYLEMDETPDECFANLLFRGGLYEDSITELKSVLNRIQHIEVKEENGAKRVSAIGRLYESMIEKALRQRRPIEAIEYAQRNLNELASWMSGTGVSLAELVSRKESSYIGRLLNNAYDNLIEAYKAQDLTRAIAAACEQESLFESAFNPESPSEGLLLHELSSAYSSLADCYVASGMFDDAIVVLKKNADLYDEKEKPASYLCSLDAIRSVYEKSNNWDDAYLVGCEQLSIVGQNIQKRGSVGRDKGRIVGGAIDCAEYLLRSNRKSEARAFLQDQANENPIVYPAAFQGSAQKRWLEKEMLRIQERIDKGEFDDLDIGHQLIQLISEWSGVEAPQPRKSNS